MLNTEKLLYILPDLTYLAELLPGKKEHSFVIQSFRQINGEFIDENEFIPANIQKLFTKIDSEEYHLILPDFLFTNTIVNIDKDTQTEAIKYVENKLLKNLNLNKETHEIELEVLTNFKGKYRIQISAIEKELLSPIRIAAKKSKVTIKAISSLSWAIKSIVSLEPSITVLQIGKMLYSSQHYIGIDQTNSFPVSELSSIAETIKTLKGAEPSIQTIYLASSSLIEEKLKEELKKTIPIQQLATYKEEDSKMPSYVKYIIESCMKTLSIEDFPVPKFKIGKTSKTEDETMKSDSTSLNEENQEKTQQENTKKTNSTNPAQTDLPEPSKVPEVAVATKAEEVSLMPKDTNVNQKQEKEVVTKSVEPLEQKPEVVEDKKDVNEDDKAIEEKEVNLSQFADQKEEETQNKKDVKPEKKEVSDDNSKKSLKIKPNKVIKNSSGVGNMIKMVFITLAVFFITIAIGIGVGLGLLKMSDKKSAPEPSPAVVTDNSTPQASPSATPEPKVEINKKDLSILVVNATTKAGYAGKIKTLLKDNDIADVTAGNAKGEYKGDANYILMSKENKSLQSLLEKTTDLTFEFSSETKAEDPDSSYDAIIVLAK